MLNGSHNVADGHLINTKNHYLETIKYLAIPVRLKCYQIKDQQL